MSLIIILASCKPREKLRNSLALCLGKHWGICGLNSSLSTEVKKKKTLNLICLICVKNGRVGWVGRQLERWGLMLIKIQEAKKTFVNETFSKF